MKKIVFLLISIAPLFAVAQVKWGLTLGGQSTDVSNMDLTTTNRSTNLMAGGMADFRIASSSFHVLTQVLYAPMGFGKSNVQAVDQSGNSIGTFAFHRISYIQVPVYVLYSGGEGDLQFQGGLGPYFALKTGDRLRINGGDTFGNETVLPGSVTEINSFLTGIGMRVGVERGGLVLAFHFHQSLNKIYETNPSNANPWKLNGFGLSLGYFLTKGSIHSKNNNQKF